MARRCTVALFAALILLAPVVGGTAAEGRDPATWVPLLADDPVACVADDTRHDVVGRVFPPAELALGYLTFDEFEVCIAYLAARYPDRVTLEVYGESREGRDLYVVEVTDAASDVPYEERAQFLVDASIHGNERIGVEGGVRLIEDLATASDAALLDLLAHQVLVMTFPNPDGWARGDRVRTGTRTNAANIDLNRNFPSVGYVRSAWRALEQPEAAATHERYHSGRHDAAEWGVSVHGYTVATRSFNQILLMAGEYDLGQAVRNQHAAQTVVERMIEATRTQALSLGEGAPGMEHAAMYGTVWETRRALNTGFLGNWLAMPEPVGHNLLGFGFEHWMTEGTQFNHPIVSYHVAASKAGLLATMELMRAEADVTLDLPRPVGYLHDPAVVTESSPGAYEPANDWEASRGQLAYEATRMGFFTDLAPYAGDRLVAVEAGEVADTLDDLDVFVVAEDLLGIDAGLLGPWVEAGGTLVLTDGAVRGLADLAGVPTEAIERRTGLLARMADGVGAGRDRFPALTPDPEHDTRDFGHPLLAGLDRADHYAEQLYEPVPVGFSLDTNASPWWTVTQAAFTAAGGRVAALDPGGRVILGDLPMGDGSVVIIGGLLPQPTNAHFHPWGLANHAVTYTGYQIFLNAVGATATLTPG